MIDDNMLKSNIQDELRKEYKREDIVRETESKIMRALIDEAAQNLGINNVNINVSADGLKLNIGKCERQPSPKDIKTAMRVLGGNDVELFLSSLEKQYVETEDGEIVKILDRSNIPWKFSTKVLGSYVAHILRDKFNILRAYSAIEKMAGYSRKSLRSYYEHKKDGIADSNYVDAVYETCISHILN